MHGCTVWPAKKAATPALARSPVGSRADDGVPDERDLEELGARDLQRERAGVGDRRAQVGVAVDDERRHVRQRPRGPPARPTRSATRRTAG